MRLIHHRCCFSIHQGPGWTDYREVYCFVSVLWQNLETLSENLSFCHWPTLSCGSGTSSTHLFTHQTPQLSEHICMMIRAYLWELYIYIFYLCAPSRSMNHTGDGKLTSRAAKRWRDIQPFSLACFEKHFSAGLTHTTGSIILWSSRGLRWYLLALCVVILNQVLEEVHSLLGLDLIYFDQVLQSKEMSKVQPGGEIKCVFNRFFGF